MPIDWNAAASASTTPKTKVGGGIDWDVVAGSPSTDDPSKTAISRRVKAAAHDVAEDVRGQLSAPANILESVKRGLETSMPGVPAAKLAMDALNVPLSVVGGAAEKATAAGQRRFGSPQAINLPASIKTALQAMPQGNLLSAGIDRWNRWSADPARMQRNVGDIAEAATPIPGVEAVEGARDLLSAAKVAKEMRVPMPVARAMIEQGVMRPVEVGGSRATRKAAGQIAKRVRLDTSGKGAPTATEILEHAGGLPRENLTLMDTTGARTKGYAGMVARGPEGAGGGTVKRFFQGTPTRPGSGRSAQLKPEMVAETQRNLGAGSSHETMDALRAHQKEQASVHYGDAFEANPRMPSSVIDEMRRDRKLGPLYQQAFDDVRARYKGKDRIYPAKDSLEVLDAFKRKLWKEAQYAKRQGNTNLENMFKSKHDQLIKELDSIDRTGGTYAKAREVWGGEQKSQDAVEFGRDDALKLSPYEIGKQFRKMTANDQELARLGLAETIRNRIAKSGTRNPASFLAHDEYLKDQIRQMFKTPAEADRFFDAATAKDIQWRTATEILGGSQTAERGGEDAAGVAEMVGHGAAALASAGKGNPLGFIYHARRGIGDFLRRPRGGVGEEAADILTQRIGSGDTQARKILQHRALQEAAAGLVKPRRFLQSEALRRGLRTGPVVGAGSLAAQEAGQSGP